MIAYSEGALRNNSAVVEYCRISMAALSGSTAGLLGLTGLYGFGFYIFAVVGLWVRFESNIHKPSKILDVHLLYISIIFQALLLMKTGGQWQKYFMSRQSLLTHGFFGGLFVSFFFTTLIFDI